MTKRRHRGQGVLAEGCGAGLGQPTWPDRELRVHREPGDTQTSRLPCHLSGRSCLLVLSLEVPGWRGNCGRAKMLAELSPELSDTSMQPGAFRRQFPSVPDPMADVPR